MNNLLEKLKTQLKAALKWYRENIVLAIVISVVGLLLAFGVGYLLYIFFRDWFAIILAIIVLLLLSRISTSQEEYVSTAPTVPEYQIIADLLCSALSRTARSLGLVAPEIYTDVYPVNCTCRQTIGNVRFYRMKCRYNRREDIDIRLIKQVLNDTMKQLMMTGYPNVPFPSFSDCPPYYLVNAAEDNSHGLCVELDVMPVDSCDARNFVIQSIRQDFNDSTPYDCEVSDEDF